MKTKKELQARYKRAVSKYRSGLIYFDKLKADLQTAHEELIGWRRERSREEKDQDMRSLPEKLRDELHKNKH